MGLATQILLLGLIPVLFLSQLHHSHAILCPICFEIGNGSLAARYESLYYYQYDPTWNSCSEPKWTTELTACMRITIAPQYEDPETFHLPVNLLIGLPEDIFPLEKHGDQLIKAIYIDSDYTKFLFEFCWGPDCSTVIKTVYVRPTPQISDMAMEKSSFGNLVTAAFLAWVF